MKGVKYLVWFAVLGLVLGLLFGLAVLQQPIRLQQVEPDRKPVNFYPAQKVPADRCHLGSHCYGDE